MSLLSPHLLWWIRGICITSIKQVDFTSPLKVYACCGWAYRLFCRLLGYVATLVSDATLADVLLAGMVLAVFSAWRRWGRFREEKPEW